MRYLRHLRYALPLLWAALAASTAYSHHSFAATYFVDREVTIEGPITQFMYRNPHSFIKVAAPDDKGEVQTWAIEWGGGAQLTQEHVSRDTLKPGDIVTVTGNPGRDPTDHRIRLHRIVRKSDGWKWEGVIM
jgi:DNA/RNA endonuclease YhcR with UshA esterase domain